MNSSNLLNKFTNMKLQLESNRIYLPKQRNFKKVTCKKMQVYIYAFQNKSNMLL